MFKLVCFLSNKRKINLIFQTIPSIFQTCMNALTNEERQSLADALNSTTSPQNHQVGSTNHIMNHHASV